jgi:YegS/Rv2252/BmrU family lipid kinase
LSAYLFFIKLILLPVESEIFFYRLSMRRTGSYSYLFIINPKAGKGRFRKLIPYIKSNFPSHIPYDIVISQFPGEARDMIRKRFDEYDVFVAAGGDGTVNEVSGELINSGKLLGLIAIGSGNGLARSMGIPLDYRKALEVLIKSGTRRIDTIKINDRTFINMAGTGFDGYVARRFEGSGKRGIIPYAKIVPRAIISHKPQVFSIQVDGVKMTKKAYMISIANTTQFGGGAHICPPARPDDGIAHLVILRSFRYFLIPGMAVRLFAGNIQKSKAIEIYHGKNLIISGDKLCTHIDGEPVELGDKLEISVIPESVSIIC